VLAWARRLAWAAGWPLRTLLVGTVRGYRVSIGSLFGGNCRFHPSCSAYAEQAIRDLGVIRGGTLAMWRVLRCSPLTAGGVDYPPKQDTGSGAHTYDADIHVDRPSPALMRAQS